MQKNLTHQPWRLLKVSYFNRTVLRALSTAFAVQCSQATCVCAEDPQQSDALLSYVKRVLLSWTISLLVDLLGSVSCAEDAQLLCCLSQTRLLVRPQKHGKVQLSEL